MRTKGAPEALGRTVGHEIESFGLEYPLNVKTVAQGIGESLVEEHVIALMSSFFAGLALLLASVGLYGVVSYAVTRWTREIGIRVALGACPASVLWAVLRETMALALARVGIGIPCGLAASRLIGSMLFGISSDDLPTLGAASLLLLVVALLAGYVPARRASRIDPMVALRIE